MVTPMKDSMTPRGRFVKFFSIALKVSETLFHQDFEIFFVVMETHFGCHGKLCSLIK
jgi:hypothetical protein